MFLRHISVPQAMVSALRSGPQIPLTQPHTKANTLADGDFHEGEVVIQVLS